MIIGGMAGGASTFLGLTDTPNSYAGEGGKVAAVNVGETALEFIAAGGSGTVTSVALAMPSIFTVSGSPVTAAGTLTASLATQAANLVFAGPAAGGAATPTFRSLVAADIPNLDAGKITTGQLAAARGGTGLDTSGSAAGGLLYLSGIGTWAVRAAGSDTEVLTLAGGVPTWAAPTVGTVTSVGLSLPAELTVSGSPVTSTGTLAATWANQSANEVFAGPASGAATTPGFRALVADDIPSLAASKITTGQLAAARGGTGLDTSGSAAGGILYLSALGTWSVLSIGTSGQVLTESGGFPSWAAAGGGSAAWESSGGQWRAVPADVTAGDYFYYDSSVADGASAIGHVFDTINALSTSGAKIASFQTNSVEKSYIDKGGGYRIGTTISMQAGITSDGTKGVGEDGSGNVTFGRSAGQRLYMGSGFTDFYVGSALVTRHGSTYVAMFTGKTFRPWTDGSSDLGSTVLRFSKSYATNAYGTANNVLLAKSAYGSIYVNGGGGQTTNATPSTFDIVTNFDTDGLTYATTADSTTNNRVTATYAGDYRVTHSGSFSGTANATIQLRVYKNGSVTHIRCIRLLNAGGDVGAFSYHGHLTLAATDYVDVRVSSDGGSDTFTQVDGVLSIERID